MSAPALRYDLRREGRAALFVEVPGGATQRLRLPDSDAKTRFVDSVMNGKRNMPPWDDVLKPDDLDALWAYVSTGDPGD